MENEIVVKEAPSVLNDMATRFGMDKRAFEATLKATVVPANVSNEQLAAFLLVAKQYNLNPITKEIYAFPAKSGGIQPIVGIDGWCNIINSHPQLNGIKFEDKLHEDKLISITCRIYRKDREHPVECTEYMEECKRDTLPWKQWPARMLRHKALIQCARYAFSFSGIVEQDEAERQDIIDVTPKDKNAHFMREVRHAIQDEMNAPMKVVAAEAAAQVASGIELKKSPFKTHIARKEYKDNTMATLNGCITLIELENVMGGLSDLAIMKESENEHDRFAYKDIHNHYSLIRNRLSIASRETPEDDTFDEEEIPNELDEQFKARTA